MRRPAYRLLAGICCALVLAAIPYVVGAQSIGTTFTFNDTRHGGFDTILRNAALNFPKYSGGGTLSDITITLSLNISSQELDIYGTCAGNSECSQWIEVDQYIHAEPFFTIVPGVLGTRVPFEVQPGSPVALFGAGHKSTDETSATASRTYGPIHLTRTVHVDPTDFHAFIGTGTVPIGVGLNLQHTSLCSWEEEDDSFLLYLDFTAAFLTCPTLNSTYTASWSFNATVNYVAFASGFLDATPHADAGGPYLGVTDVPVAFDASGSEVGSSTASYVISRYDWDFDNDGIFEVQSTSPIVAHTFSQPFTGPVSLRVNRNDATNDIASASVTISSRFDLDHDGDVDSADLTILLKDRGKMTSASVCGVACDFDNDGFITAVDSRLLVTHCSRTNCATQ